jgi:hypothetical protein
MAFVCPGKSRCLGISVVERVCGGILVVESPKYPHIYPISRQFLESRNSRCLNPRSNVVESILSGILTKVAIKRQVTRIVARSSSLNITTKLARE